MIKNEVSPFIGDQVDTAQAHYLKVY